jgi:PilZ domain-containing protein
MVRRRADFYTQRVVIRNTESPAEALGSLRATFRGSDFMYPSQVTPALILRARPDRRADDRYIHSQAVEINGVAAIGCDISSNGIAVITVSPLTIGDVVRVTITDSVDFAGPRTSEARVARIDRRAGRLLVGLQFIH